MKVHNPSNVAPGTGYSHGIELAPNERILYIAGQLGVSPDGKMGEGIQAQAEQAWKNIGNILAAAGMGFQNLVKVNHYITRKEDLAAYREVRARFLGDNKPASTLLVISALAREGAVVEVEAVAAKA